MAFPGARPKVLAVAMIGLVLALATPVGALASTGSDAGTQLRTALLDHELYLRDFDSARFLQWHWDGTVLVPDSSPQVKTLAALQVTHIDVAHDAVIITATRRSLLRDEGHFLLASQSVPVKLTLKIPRGEQGAALPQVPSQLFFQSRDEALAALPPIYSTQLPTSSQGTPAQSMEKCDCAELGQPACQGKSAVLGLKRPRLLSQANPEFSEEARRKKFNGQVRVLFTVDLTGHPVDLWVAHAVGLGLDENSIEAARQYTFQPGNCKGEPVLVPLAVDIDFHIF